MSAIPKPTKEQRPARRIARSARIPRKAKPPKQSNSPRAKARRKADRQWALAVKARTFGVCAYATCAKPATDAHHLWPKKSHPELRYVVTNGIGLCREHHIKAHRYMRAFRAEFA